MSRWAGITAATAFVALVAGACGTGTTERHIDPMDRIERAFATARAAGGAEIRLSSAMSMRFRELGVDSSTKIDRDHPTSILEMVGDTRHLTVDLSSMTSGSSGDLGFELWTDPHRVVIDTTGYAALAESGAQLGPFRPGVSYVDLDRVGAEAPELLAAIAGNDFDLGEFSKRLPDALDELEQTSSNPVTVTGKAMWSDLMEAAGNDLESTARSTAAGVALNLHADVDVLGQMYVDLYRRSPADVEIVFADDGTIASIEERVDMSSFWRDLVERGVELGMPSSIVAQIGNGADDATMKLTTVTDFSLRDDLVLADPPPTDEDRTDEWLALLRG